MGTRTTIDEFLRRLGEGDPERVAELFTDDVDWALDWPEDRHGGTIPWIRHRSKRADVAEHFREIALAHDPQRASAEVTGVLVDGADAVVFGVIGNTVRSTGKSYSARVALHFTVDDDMISRYHVYEDSLAVAEACTS
ncbi:nuclear transport factor 2 family protein [Haloactinopolyspora sp.]|uniref:nuclear transport factor 2 family protein n=1 Tax=Haloactinopolyspora sp. TaxID=1966353 RepID=UPI002620539B|nr:nuclear transport factor 2 family protein [Haloactinopolyspora sp.]